MTPLPTTLPAFFWHFLRKQWKLFALTQFFALAWAIDNTLWAYVFKIFVDDIVGYKGSMEGVWQALAPTLIAGAALWIVLECMYRGVGFCFARAMPRFEADIRTAMFDYVQRHSHTYFAGNFAGAIANKISDMPGAATRILQLFIFIFIPAAVGLVMATIMFGTIHPWFAVILSGWMLLHIGFCLATSGKGDRLSTEHSEARTQLAGRVVDALANNVNIRLFSRYDYENRYLARFQQEELSKHIRSALYVEKVRIVLGILSFLIPGVVLFWYMIESWKLGQITVGDVVLILNGSWRIMVMAWVSGIELPNLFREVGVCRQAIEVVQQPHGVVDRPGAKPLTVTRGEIVFDNVTFCYMPGRNIFQNKNIVIPAGQRVGLVGFSGSGKSTFVNLILRYFDVESGRILIDGQNVAEVTQDSLRESISMIPQDTTLFHRSLIENIRYGRLEASDAEVIEAARQAHALEFIERLPEGFAALVGERGVKLSVGQRQRIAIARAFLKNAPILMLDEATSALDTITEKLIQKSLASLMRGKTCIVIAHRLSTLSDMDRILVFKDGQIIEDGTHDELVRQAGHYWMLWNTQSGGFLPDTPEE